MADRRQARRALRLLALGVGGSLLAAVAFIASPLPPGLTDYRAVASLRILDRNGGLLREVLSRADGRSIPLSTERLPAGLKAAFLAAEDHGFYHHLGLSPASIARAAWVDLKARRVVEGGSTITQQLAKLLVPHPTLLGKAEEALWALRLEAHLPKAELLAQYLNRAPFGNNTFGVEAAARLYFGRSADHLSLGQEAALAAIPRGPSEYDPYRHLDRLIARQRWVLARMSSLGLIPATEAARAARVPLDLSAFRASFRAPHLVQYLLDHLEAWGLADATTIETTLDPDLQGDAEELVREEIDALADRKVSSGAAIVVDNATGEVLAYVGSVGYFRDAAFGQNDGVQMHRQPGSSLKPFAYAQAFAEGLTPASVLSDVATTFPAQNGGYSPKDYDELEHGPVRARAALANSDNIPAVHVAEKIGPTQLLQTLRRAGFEGLTEDANHYGLGLVLGDGAVSLWEEARAYSGLSRGGRLAPLRVVRWARRGDGTVLGIPDAFAPRRFVGEVPAKLVTSILSDNAARNRAFGLDSALRLPFPTAAKTGTSKGFSDNWTSGFTHERTVAVWAGNFDGSPMVGVSGVTGAGPIFQRLMLRAMRGVEKPAPLFDPRGLDQARVCPLSGELAGPDCPSSMLEYFAPGTAPTRACDFHTHLSATLPRGLARACATLAGPTGRLIDWGPAYYTWAARSPAQAKAWLAAVCAGHKTDRAATIRILSPQSGDEYRIYPDMPEADQAIPLQVRAPATDGPLSVSIDGKPLFELGAPFRGRLPPTRGRHVLRIARADGRAVGEVDYVVRGR